MKNMNNAIKRIPIFLFLLTVMVHFFATYLIPSDYEVVYYYLSEIMNTSLVANVFMLLAIYRYKLCLYNKVSVFGLLSLNATNLFFLITDFDYEVYELYLQIFMSAVMIPTAILAIILLIKKV